MEEDLLSFLRQRTVSEEALIQMEEDKIDASVISLMPDTDLQKYLPRYGDRIAVVAFCRNRSAEMRNSSSEMRKKSIIDRLRGRLVPSERLCTTSGKTMPSGSTRMRTLLGNRNGQKKQRRLELGWMDFDLQENRMKQVRSGKGGGTRALCVDRNKTVKEIQIMAEEIFFPDGKNKNGKTQLSEYHREIRDFAECEINAESTLEELYEVNKVRLLRLYLCTKRTTQEVIDEIDEAGRAPNLSNRHSTPQSQLHTTSSVDYPLQDLTGGAASQPSLNISIDEEIQLGAAYLLDEDPVILDDTLPMMLPEPTTAPQITRLKLRRGNVFHDLNAAFHEGRVSVDDTLLEIEMVLPNGLVEKGEDNWGVLRDALSEYWDTFIGKCTSGNTVKVPMTRHDMKDSWEDVAQVLVHGYNMSGYFPVSLPKPFLQHCLGQEYEKEELIASFLHSLPNEEMSIVEEAMKDFSAVKEREDWHDFLEEHEVRILVTKESWDKTLIEVAHKEIIQDPAYISDCWSPYLKKLKLPPGGLNEVLSALKPNNKKVTAALKHEETITKREQNIFDYLKKYIRNCTEERLRQFLRFCTGANVLISPTIYVRFVEPSSDFVRTPQSHTCGCVLELPNTYSSYLEMAEEFTAVLDSKVWVMDII